MKKLTNLFKKLADADTQALAEAGYINGDLEMTSKGQQILIETLFLANKAALVAAANAEIAEAKEKESKE